MAGLKPRAALVPLLASDEEAALAILRYLSVLMRAAEAPLC